MTQTLNQMTKCVYTSILNYFRPLFEYVKQPSWSKLTSCENLLPRLQIIGFTRV